jgi:hypothetical protein
MDPTVGASRPPDHHQPAEMMRMLAAELALPPGSTAPSTARRWVASQLAATKLFPDGWQDGGRLFDVLICTSELVNASLTANSTAMSLRLQVRDRTVRVSLVDDGSDTGEHSDARMHAQLFGLRIFDSVTDDWGIDSAPGRRMLWFELSADSQAVDA